jgi:hypothetical protein
MSIRSMSIRIVFETVEGELSRSEFRTCSELRNQIASGEPFIDHGITHG